MKCSNTSKNGRNPKMSDKSYRCSRCNIPDFLAMKFYVINGKDVCESCITKAEERNFMRERYKRLGLDDSELDKKDKP